MCVGGGCQPGNKRCAAPTTPYLRSAKHINLEVSAQFPRIVFGGSPVKREGGGRGMVAASALPYSRGTSVRKGWRKSMWGRFGEGRTGREERAYGSAVWLGAGGVLAMATLILLLLWLLG